MANQLLATVPACTRRCVGPLQRASAAALLFAFAGACLGASAPGSASGTVALGKRSAVLTHAIFVEGPDEMSPGASVHRIYLTAADVGAAVKACKTLSCADAAIHDGMSVDYVDSSHLGYWVGLEGGRVQYSGGTGKDAFVMKTLSGERLAGTLHIDDSAASGAKIDVEFDAPLIATFKSAR